MSDNNYISLGDATVYDVTLKRTAEVLSDVQTRKGNIPLSYSYENAEGNRFLVFNVNTRWGATDFFAHQARGRQIAECITWLSGEKLPAYVYGCPSLYMQCKRNEGAMAVGLWNFFADTAIEPTVTLDGVYKGVKFTNCNGRLEGDKVYLTDIAPFAFAGFEVYK